MAKYTKKQEESIRNLCDKMMKIAFHEGYLKGQCSVLEYFKEQALNSFAERYAAVSNVAIIKMCDEELNIVNKELNKLKKNE